MKHGVSRQEIEARNAQILAMRVGGASQAQCAAAFGVTGRQVRRIEREAGHSKGLVSVRRLSPRRQKLLAGLIENKSGYKAAIEAGYAPGTAKNIRAEVLEKPAVKKALTDLLRDAVPDSLFARRVREGVDALETKFFAEKGLVRSEREVIDFDERRRYLELVARLTGDLGAEVSGLGAVEVVVRHIGAGPAAAAK